MVRAIRALRARDAYNDEARNWSMRQGLDAKWIVSHAMRYEFVDTVHDTQQGAQDIMDIACWSAALRAAE
jgi:hypothetical protein